VRAAAGETESSPQVDATRAPTLGSTGSEATGLAPPSMIAKGIGSVSVRKHSPPGNPLLEAVHWRIVGSKQFTEIQKSTIPP
jgi:hypothetical protein